MNSQSEFQSKPIGFKESIISINKSRINEMIDNTFCVFTSVNNVLYIVYAHEKSILFHNLLDNKAILEIKEAHKKDIINFRYFFDEYKNRDLISSAYPVQETELNPYFYRFLLFACNID